MILLSLLTLGLSAAAPAPGELVRLDLPTGLPAELVIDVPRSDGAATLVLTKHSNRAAGYRLLEARGDGLLHEVPTPPVSTYRGHVAEAPEWSVAATLLPGGLKALVRHSSGVWWSLEPEEQGAHRLLEAGDDPLPPGFCGAELLPLAPSGMGTAFAGTGSGCFREAEIAFDADHENYLLHGSDSVATALNIEAALNAVNDMFAREVAISHLISATVVRTVEPDPYPSFDPGTLLNDFRSEWNTVHAGVPRDLAHLATGKEMDGNIIGLAWVGVACNQSWGYALTQFNLSFGGVVSVLAHELGHNWNAPHCLDPACVIMCGGCLEFGPVTTGVVRSHRDAVGCLTTTDGYALPVPPKVLDEELTGTGPVVVDVLANDFDGNCDPLVIQSFDAASVGGGLVELSPGTGPGGRDELRYTPPPGFEGVDRFGYSVGDGTGLTSPGEVRIKGYDGQADLALHYRLDELVGPDFLDDSGNGLHGDQLGPMGLGLPGATPTTGTSIGFNGAFSRGQAPNGAPLNGLNGSFSLLFWVRPEALSGRQWIFGNPGSWKLELDGADLVFTSGGNEHVDTTGLVQGAWQHVAVVFEADGTVRFFIDGSSVSQVSGGTPGGLPSGPWLLAGKGAGLLLFDGGLDDLQVYDHGLQAAEVAWLYQHPGEVWVECEPILNECVSSPNSAGPGAEITFAGSPSLSSNDLALLASGCPPQTIGLFYFGSEAAAIPFGDGVRCVDQDITRLTPVLVDGLGGVFQALDLSGPPFDSGPGQVAAGDRKHFQFWYRDVPAGNSGFNLSDALSVTFCP